MADLHGWILEQIGVREEAARDATEGPWFADHPEGSWGDDPGARLVGQGKILALFSNDNNGHLNVDHIALHSPDAVLRRCAADRKLLEIHKPRGTDFGYDPNVCEGCGQEGYCQDWVTEHANDCPVLLAVAEGYGLTPEILAGLDRPQLEPSTPVDGPTIGYVPSKVWEDAIVASLKATFDIPREPSPREKALDILAPELRQVPLYRPSDEA